MQKYFWTLLGIKSKCKLLTLYKVPQETDGIIDICVLCIESKGFEFDKHAKRFFEQKWMQIEDGDESSEITIRSGEEINLEFRGYVNQKERQNPVIKFLKNGSNCSCVRLYHVDSKYLWGCILIVRGDTVLDWKRLNWRYLVEKFEGKLILIYIMTQKYT